MRVDMEQDQLLEECNPPGCLSQEEVEVYSFPFPYFFSQHHNCASIHDCILFFWFRKSNKNNDEIDGRDDKYLYGYVFNRQRHDERLKRGGEQKYVVNFLQFVVGNILKMWIFVVNFL